MVVWLGIAGFVGMTSFVALRSYRHRQRQLETYRSFRVLALYGDEIPDDEDLEAVPSEESLTHIQPLITNSWPETMPME